MAKRRLSKRDRKKTALRDLPFKGADVSDPGIKTKFEVYGQEMVEKEVKQSGNSGRVYLPPDWIGKPVKIIRID